MHLIGLLGRSRSGKDTVAHILLDALKPTNYRLRHISKPLKDALKSMYGYDDSHVFGKMKDVRDLRYDKTPRDLCHEWNQKLASMHGPDFLVRRTFDDYDAHVQIGEQVPHWIIPDVRYPHDCDAIQARGGIIWKITRADLPFKLSHEDHIDRLDGDACIQNSADINALRESVLRILNQTRKTHPT